MRVLLVEAEERLARIVREGLEAQGVNVDVEHDGEAGLWRGPGGPYHAVRP